MTAITPQGGAPPRVQHPETCGPRDFEGRYRTQEEPWGFGRRAAEILRHEWIARTTRQLAPNQLLDVGCSLGQLTKRLATIGARIHAVDISPTAVARARTLVESTVRVSFTAGSATSLPYAARSFDLVLACDGLYSWELDACERQEAIAEIQRVVRVGGHALFTEHTRPERFPHFIEEITQGGFRVISVSYLYDRPWYQFESWFGRLRGWGLRTILLRSVRVAVALQFIGRAIGRTASRHVCVLTERPS